MCLDARQVPVEVRLKLGIDGNSRQGRLLLRHLATCPGIDVVGYRQEASPKVLAHLIRHDTVHGRASFEVGHEKDAVILGDRRIPLLEAGHPFPRLDVMLDARKRLTTGADVEAYLDHAGRVLVAGPCEGADGTVVLGVNDGDMEKGRVLSAASPTTHALAWMLHVLEGAFGLEYALMTAVHAYTIDQQLLDLPHEDLRRARSATMSMVPTPSRSVACLEKVLPHFKGRVEGLSVRVPSPDVSLIDLTAWLPVNVNVDEINAAFQRAAENNPYLAILDEELVSPDLVGREESCIFDPFLTKVMQGRMVKVFGWYDNEWAYVTRLKEMLLKM